MGASPGGPTHTLETCHLLYEQFPNLSSHRKLNPLLHYSDVGLKILTVSLTSSGLKYTFFMETHPLHVLKH
jgi:hypothetical protein